MCNSPEFLQQLSTGGLSWWADLTVTDPYYILPLLCSSMTLLTMEVAMRLNKQTQQPALMMFFRVFSIASFFFAAYFPAVRANNSYGIIILGS